MLQAYGSEALIGMISHVFFIVITWWALQGIRIEGIFKKGRIMEARIVFLFVTIAIGTTVSNFFLDFLEWSQDLVFLFY
jgi:uncharacterized integral membrane protein (TIGR02327 family)